MTDATDRCGLLVVVSGPSGAGKTTIVRTARQRLDGVFSVSATTRAPAAGERDGVDYSFIDRDTFQSMIDEGAFFEYAQVFGRDWYGTPRKPIEQALAEGRVVLLDIDVQGAEQVRRACPEALLVFIEPPDLDELARRLRSRGRDKPEAIERRLGEARREIERARASGAYDAFVVNRDLAQAEEQTCALILRALEPPRSRARA